MTDTGGLYVVNITPSPANTWGVTDTGTTISGVNGTSFGFDFNPVVDRLRVTSDTDINLRHQVGAATIVDGNINAPYGNPSVVGAAYLNNFAGTTTTTLFTIDSANDSLNTQNPPNAGTQVVVGPLGIDVNSEELGFDIESGTNVAYVAANVGPDRRSGLYTVNLATGATTSLGLIGNGTLVRDITVVIPEPASLACSDCVVAPDPVNRPITWFVFAARVNPRHSGGVVFRKRLRGRGLPRYWGGGLVNPLSGKQKCAQSPGFLLEIDRRPCHTTGALAMRSLPHCANPRANSTTSGSPRARSSAFQGSGSGFPSVPALREKCYAFVQSVGGVNRRGRGSGRRWRNG